MATGLAGLLALAPATALAGCTNGSAPATQKRVPAARTAQAPSVPIDCVPNLVQIRAAPKESEPMLSRPVFCVATYPDLGTGTMA